MDSMGHKCSFVIVVVIAIYGHFWGLYKKTSQSSIANGGSSRNLVTQTPETCRLGPSRLSDKLAVPVTPVTPVTGKSRVTPHNSLSKTSVIEELSTKEIVLKIYQQQAEILQRLKGLEKQSANVSNEKTTVKVPPGVKNAVRGGYKNGKSKGLSWHFDGKRVTDAINDEMTTHVKNFVKGWNPTYDDPTVVNQALCRYFMTKKQETTAVQQNKKEEERKKRASYERKKEKAKRRLKALGTCKDIEASKRAKIEMCLEAKYMSSDEECEDGFITHPPSWQSPKFKEYKRKLDKKFLDTCNIKSRRLLTKRTIGGDSQKEIPELPDTMKWMIN